MQGPRMRSLREVCAKFGMSVTGIALTGAKPSKLVTGVRDGCKAVPRKDAEHGRGQNEHDEQV